MAYSEFTLERIKAQFQITFHEDPIFTAPQSVPASERLLDLLSIQVPLALANATKKARSEFVSPQKSRVLCGRCP